MYMLTYVHYIDLTVLNQNYSSGNSKYTLHKAVKVVHDGQKKRISVLFY